ncbi:hypothetical protein EJB05_44932 [Eragrostis curvula]|uniref:Uncharacterized protein n=1 Tax=Eragrostis curvula TaxID=38414 RepID=A0A5J9TJ08_9POAL|nr:hypothetical protein EJB05_44932 [Eragrostis curvula]
MHPAKIAVRVLKFINTHASIMVHRSINYGLEGKHQLLTQQIGRWSFFHPLVKQQLLFISWGFFQPFSEAGDEHAFVETRRRRLAALGPGPRRRGGAVVTAPHLRGRDVYRS